MESLMFNDGGGRCNLSAMKGQVCAKLSQMCAIYYRYHDDNASWRIYRRNHKFLDIFGSCFVENVKVAVSNR